MTTIVLWRVKYSILSRKALFMFPYLDKVLKLSFQGGNKRVDHVQKYFLTICTTWKIKRWIKVYTKLTGICIWLDRHAISVSETVGPSLRLPINGPLLQTDWWYFWTSGSNTVCSVWILAVAIWRPTCYPRLWRKKNK